MTEIDISHKTTPFFVPMTGYKQLFIAQFVCNKGNRLWEKLFMKIRNGMHNHSLER
jgi:hypothetical protein